MRQCVQIRAAGLLLAVAVLLALVAEPASATPAARSTWPERYLVSTQAGVLPEGIGLARDGRTMYVTSSGTGAVYRGDVRASRLRLFAPAGDAGRTSAAGVHVDQAGRVFVAGREGVSDGLCKWSSLLKEFHCDHDR